MTGFIMTEYFLQLLVVTGFKNTIKPKTTHNRLKTVAKLGKDVKWVELKEEQTSCFLY